MISSNLGGGLGNYLFQIATGYSLAIDNNDTYVIDDRNVMQVHKNISTYKSNLLRNIKSQPHNFLNTYQEPFFHFCEIPYNDDLKLGGYFQSEKYFIKNREKILELFSIDEDSKNYINTKYKNLDFNNICSLHIRRGDYLYYPNHHPQTELKYFYDCVKQIDNSVLLVFSDDIEWCKTNLIIPNKEIIYVEGNTDFIDLWVMSLCKNNIITNSTFSWWGAWLNKNKNKRVFAPKKWFGDAIKHNIKDLIPESWTQR